MKKTLLALLLAAALMLTGCSTMLELRDDLYLTEYVPVASTGSSPTLRVDSYQGLLNAVLALISAGEEHGVLNLYNYTAQDVETDLARACLEAVQEDPLGAYVVDYITHDHFRVVSYYEVHLNIAYRRTHEQVAAIVSATGSRAIRQELANTLTAFSTEEVLRIGYFTEDEEYIHNLVRQAYYDAPVAALGWPEVSISLYPKTGHQRIVEILLTYPEAPETLLARSQMLKEQAVSLVPESPSALQLYLTVRSNLTLEEGTGHSTAWDALTAKVADSEGAALAYKLLCDQAGIPCLVVLGQRGESEHFWNVVSEDGVTWRHVDLSAERFGLTDTELTEMDAYTWDQTEYPACTAPAVEEVLSEEKSQDLEIQG